MNKSGVRKETAGNVVQILFNTENFISVSTKCAATGAVTEGAKKVLKAGTPMTGDIAKRDTAFAKGTDANAVGVLLHDVDVTDGTANGAILLHGAINLDRLDAATKALYTAPMVTQLSRIFCLSDN